MDQGPRYRVLPPIALGLPLVVGILASRLRPEPWRVPDALDAALLLGLAGACVGGWAFVTLARHRTTWMPGVESAALVTDGPFAWTRNPLYVTMTLLYAAVALAFGSTWALVLLPLGLAALVWGAIVPEERYLAQKFGDDYDAYRRRVRRWL